MNYKKFSRIYSISRGKIILKINDNYSYCYGYLVALTVFEEDYRCRLLRELATPAVMISYSSLSKISIISAAVITCGSFGKCLRLPVTKKESSLLRQIS